MKSALDRLVIDAREMTKDTIAPSDLPNNSMNSEGREAERRLSQGVFDESIVTETDGDEEDDTREMIFPTPPPIASSSYRVSRSLDVDIALSDLQQEMHPIVDEISLDEYEEEDEEDEEERASTPVPPVKRDMLSPRLPELRRFSFESDMGFGSTIETDPVTLPSVPPIRSFGDAPTVSSPSIPPFRPFTAAPAVPSPSTPKSPRSAIGERQAAIAQRRKELREADEEIVRNIQLENEAMERERQAKWQQQQVMAKQGEGRKSARRSLSTGDADGLVLHPSHIDNLGLLDVSIAEDEDEGLNLNFEDRGISSRKEGLKDVGVWLVEAMMTAYGILSGSIS
jgi:hypothetical protein